MKFLTTLLLLISTASLAGPVVNWNGSDAKFYNSGSVIVPGLSGVGCAQFDVNGKLTNTGSSCGSGSGTVTGVTASSPLASSGGAAPNITLSTAVPASKGGTGIDTSASTGISAVASGTWSINSVTTTFVNLYETVATTLGDIVYGGASGTPTRLAGNTTTTPQVLTSTGTGSAATAPAWQALSSIGISTDAATYTPTFSSLFGTVSANVAKQWRVGDRQYVQGTFTSGTLGSGLATVSLPGAETIDSSKVALAGTTSGPCERIGTWTMGSSNLFFGWILACTSSSTSVVYFGPDTLQSANMLVPSSGTGSYSSSTPFSYNFSVPITAWSSATIGVGQGSVLAAYGLTTGYTPSGGANVLYDTKISDAPTPNFNTGTGVFTSPVTGTISVKVCGFVTSSNTDFYLVKNGSVGTPGGYLMNAPNSGASGSCGSMDIPVQAGDTLAIRQNSAIALGGSTTNGYRNWVSFTLASGNGTNQNSYWTGYTTVSSGCSTTSSSLTDPGTCTGAAVTTLDSSGFTCVQGTSGTPSISCNFLVPGHYKVTANVGGSASGGGTFSTAITDSSNAFVAPPMSVSPVNASLLETSLQGGYNITSAGSTSFKIRMATNSGTYTVSNGLATGSAAIQWTVTYGGP